MNIKNKIKENSSKLINIASENVTKAFDYPAIKSKELKDGIKIKFEKRQF